MASTASKKANVISRTIAASDALLTLMTTVSALRQEAIDSGFATGGADAIVDGDFTGDNVHVTTAKLIAAFNVFSALDTALAASARANYIALQLLRR